MADKKISAVNLLPEYFKTLKNKKFLSSTIDQLIQKPQLESIDGYVGNTNTPTFKSTDAYISNGNPYQLDPALILQDKIGTVTDTQGYDDLINDIAAKGGFTDNLDRLLRTKYYSYTPYIDWDKLVNYQDYFWRPFGPEVLEIPTSDLNIDTDIVGLASAQVNVLLPDGTTELVELSNGMLISFGGLYIDSEYSNKNFFVEGVGTSIKLVPYDSLLVSETFLTPYPDGFDSNPYDDLPYDNDRELPNLKVEYVTINRASEDLNPWSRYNRWVHKDVIKQSAMLNGVSPDLSTGRAQRPIIEFKANIKLFNFGTKGILPVDLIDTSNLDPFSTVEGATEPVYIDGVLVENGHRIIFNADELSGFKGKVYEVEYINRAGQLTLTLNPTYEPVAGEAITVLLGDTLNGTEWWFDGNVWQYAQQKETLNQAPLFDLFDQSGNSYSDKNYYLSDFAGNKIFSYSVGTGTADAYLGFPIKYRRVNTIGSILFDNNLCNETIVVSQISDPTYTISTNAAFVKINNEYKNAWTQGADYPIPLLSSTATGILSYYEEPLSLTNNPLNGLIDQFTISELTDHVKSMVNKMPPTSYLTPLRDRSDYTNLGTSLISNDNPIAFAQMFIGQQEHDVISAIQKSADNYNTFKTAFLNKASMISDQISPVDAVDLILTELNQDKVYENSYYLSDMVGYGYPDVVRSWTVTRLMVNNSSFPLESDFDLKKLSTRAVYVYKNGEQLVHGVDYVFNTDTTTIDVVSPVQVGDVIVMRDYKDTTANYIPLTPSKLGLYPSFVPSLFEDSTYTVPQTVIQGHDGSITIAYNDYRDAIILELEKRIYNNIKAKYNPELFDINSVIPTAFNATDYSLQEVNQVLEGDFVRWATRFGIDYVSNNTFDENNSKTWNLFETKINFFDTEFSGSFRALLMWLYGTDKPHLAPWEMLGIYEKPTWWESTYGPAPYTSGNLILWNDIELGSINGTINASYARPGLSNILPVDEDGNLVSVTQLISNTTDANIRRPWQVGDVGPAEAAWRRSSYYPFAVQRLLALTKPADYTSHLYDTSRVTKNIAGQWIYQNNTFFKLSDLRIYGEENTLTSGYSAFISEIGTARDKGYKEKLRQDLSFATYRLFSKLNGYVDKDTLQIIVDAYEPTSTAPGSVLPSQNYTLWFNKSNPLMTLAISGIIVQKVEGGYSIRGYDKQEAFFNTFKPLRNLGTASLNVGGVSEKYVVWQPSGETSGVDTTTASSAPTGNFYQVGQYVEYNNVFYKTKVAHRSGSTFNLDYFQRIPKLPTKGGATVQIAAAYESSVTRIPYGTFYRSIQEVYDAIIGYGRWLESQGFVFNEYNPDLDKTLDWNLSAEEFLFWSTQAWDLGSIITLSPFANSITYQSNLTVVDNLFDSFYEYSVLGANGSAFPKEDLNISRESGVCLIQTVPESDGIYFARLNLVQKEHAVIFDNSTIFGDIIYNPETGNRQHRVKLVGFKTSAWDGGLTSPGFVYDKGAYTDWAPNNAYIIGDCVRFNGNYYSANQNVERSSTFDFTKWDSLLEKPVPGLLPNFDYKISQFEDFYSLDSDNFDAGQQKMAQHLTGYTPRVYLNNIFPDPIAQYKFYQGFIREKGTKNAVSKISKISEASLKGSIDFKEEWAFRVGHYGSFRTYTEIETPLVEGTFLENPQILSFVSEPPVHKSSSDLIYYVTPGDLTIVPEQYTPASLFASTATTDAMLLQHSGYVRISDVTATAYSENSLLDIANAGQLKDGDTIWLGFKDNGDWDVYRYTYRPVDVVGVYVSAPLSAITFTTKYPHKLSAGQIIGVNNFNSQVDGIYKVLSIDSAKQFTVSSELASIENAPLPAPGQLFVFESVRISTFDNLPSDKILFRANDGAKYWIDGTEVSGWEVYEKVNNYSSTDYIDTFAGTAYGKGLSHSKGSNIIVIGAPRNSARNYVGRISVLEKQDNGSYTDIVRWRIGAPYANVPTGFGSTVVYDDFTFTGSKYGLVFVGAPLVNGAGVVKISSINSKEYIEGVKTFIENPEPLVGNNFGQLIAVEKGKKKKRAFIASSTAVYTYIVEDVSGQISVTFEGKLTSSTAITSLAVSDDSSIIAVGTDVGVEVYNSRLLKLQTLASVGNSVTVSVDGKLIIVGSTHTTNDDDSSGVVSIYKQELGTYDYTTWATEFNLTADQVKLAKKIADTYYLSNNYFGIVNGSPRWALYRSPDAAGLEFWTIRAQTQYAGNVSALASEFFSLSNSSADGIRSLTGTKDFDAGWNLSAFYDRPFPYALDQRLYNPVEGAGMNFGYAVDLNPTGNLLAVSATGVNHTLKTTFDGGKMSFDGGTTTIKGTKAGTGTVYIYSKKDSRFVFAQEVTNSAVLSTVGNNYGDKIILSDDYLIATMPAIDNTGIEPGFFLFDKIDLEVNGYKLISSQDVFTDPSTINRIALIDTDSEKVIEYLDIYDPLKGRIPGIAEQELTYKLVNDPAIYSIGVQGTNVDTEKNWLDDKVGQLWWDLSTAKYQWYEQGDLEYRKNNWGKLFPGATIDVYEWVSSTMLPSEWATLADTTEGLSKGISGQPRFSDNSVISVKQVYDTVTNSFTNIYYYWVKNKTIKPSAKNRRMSAYDVAAAIADPKAYGIKFASIISPNAITLSNLGNLPVSNKISINIAQDNATEFVQSPKHTQWFILEEGSDIKMPPAYLEKKLIDSILGHDKFGSLVPDPTLSPRTKYGIGIRPQQSMFVDRHAALRNIIEFANDALLSTPVNGYYSFKNLNAQEEIPSKYENLYDYLVEDNTTLESINTTGWERAILNCSINSNGEVDNVVIANSGFGFGKLNPVQDRTGTIIGYEGPTFTVDDATYATTFDQGTTIFDENRTKFITRDEPNLFAEGLKITTRVDEDGRIVQATIVNAGKRFGANFRLISRPHTVVVQSDDTYNGKWSRFEWDYILRSWNRAHTQSYNTTLYWNFVDYASADYNQYQIYSAVVGAPYELDGLDLQESQYVKVNNGGDGNYIVLKKTAVGVYGTYGNGYDLVYKQNGTIQFKDDLWKVKDNPLNWDYINPYDKTLYDQTPDIELEYIFAALKHDLFVYDKKVNWNLLFFKAVKYALSEQRVLDWAFKTSFITLTHTIGELTQPPVYKMQDSSYYEDYVKEVKPYHTQIRTFTTKYTVTQTQDDPVPLTIANTDLTELDRTTTVELKFDRTSFDNTVGSFEVLDTFVSNGIDKEFDLSWVPAFDKIGISVKFNGVVALGSEWTINYSERLFNGFHKSFATLVTLQQEALPAGTVITIKYKKNAGILNETERVLAYYTATYGTVGLDLTTLVEGIGYPGLEVGGQYEGPGFSNPYGGVTPDSLITGGTWINGEKNTAMGVNPEDITISGEVGFINTFSGHAPSELLPGFTIDTLGINVYTVGRAQSPTIVTSNVDILPSTTTQYFSLPALPVATNNISVVLNNAILEYTANAPVKGSNTFSIDWQNQLLVIPEQTTSGVLSYSLVGIGGGTNNFGLIDHEVAVANNSTTGLITSGVLADVVVDAYVTVNGVETTDFVLDTTAGINGPAIVQVNNLDAGITSVIQAWFFTESHENFDRIVEQISTTSTFDLTSTGTHVLELIQSGKVEHLTNAQYYITGTTVVVQPGLLTPGDQIKVITFIDATGTLGVSEVEFIGDPSRRFVMASPVSNDNYVWVSIIKQDGTTYGLTNGDDFTILDDNVTIQISDAWDISNLDTVEVISFNAPQHLGNVLGYRMFKDMLGNTTYTRLSAAHTTRLTKELLSTDTEIHVADSSVLTAPLVEENIPGVVLINAERIEFFQIDGNILKQITRGTLGTGINSRLSIGADVVDQGTEQEFATSEQIKVQFAYTTSSLNTYVINLHDTTVTVPNTTASIVSKGIELNYALPLNDQVDVYLGGRKLRKDAVFIHDTTVVLDNIDISTIKGNVLTSTDLTSVVAMPGDSYVDISTGKVWSYTKTRSDNVNIPGWAYSGLTYATPEFAISYNGIQQTIQLNTEINNDLELAIVKKSATVGDFNEVVNTTTSRTLWDSTTSIATFLKESPTQLPSVLSGSLDLPLTDEGGRVLVNETGAILTGRI